MKQKKNQTDFKYPTQWNLKHLYDSPQDPKIELDLKMHRQKRKDFAQKYQNRTDYLTDASKLLKSLIEYEQLISDLSGAKPLMYFHYLTAVESNQTKYQAKLNKITHQFTKAHNQLTFFPIQIGKIDPALQNKFLDNKKLSKYHFFLSKRFELAKYDLPEEQEKLLNLTYQTSHQMWVKGVEKSLNQLTVNFEGKKLPLSTASQKISELPTKRRRKLHQLLLSTACKVKDFAESEVNAVITHKITEDELRGYKLPFEETVLSFDNDLDTTLLLIETITKNFDLSTRFYQLKAKLLKEKTLTYADRAAKINNIKHKYSFDQAFPLINETFQELDPEFSQISNRLIKNGQLDVYPKKNKVSGAFCSSSINNPTYVLLNHTDDFNSVTTLAHEMGHAIHSELSKTQPVFYQHYSPSTAETASTFFEQFVFEKLIENFSKKEKVVALHNKIQEDVNTIFRQAAFFNFELELHNEIKKQGYLEVSQIGAILNKHMQSYLGSSFKLTDQDGLFFILWPHLRYFFYTYTYAFGHLISKALVQQVKNNPKNIKLVKTLLNSGGKAKPADLFKNINIDITQPDFFISGLQTVEKNLNELESLINN